MDKLIGFLRPKTLLAFYIIGFLFTLHFTLLVYISSTFLAEFISERFVGLIYTVSSLLTVLAFFVLPKIIKRRGDYGTTMLLFALDLLALLGLSISTVPLVVFTCFAIQAVSAALIAFNMDVLLESYSTNEETGGIRGAYLSITTIAWIIAPIIAGHIADTSGYAAVFFLSMLVLIPTMLAFRAKFSGFRDPAYKDVSLKKALADLVLRTDVRKIMGAMFLLQFFFSWMTIYIPIYLHTHIGFSWETLGVIFGIMLVPYGLLEAPLGRLADTRWGEKEILTAGFIIMALSTALISFIPQSENFFLWASVLFVTRIGAATVEIMGETYFFKVTDSTDVHLLSFFRSVRPFAYMFGPLAATVLALFVPIQFLFLILGIGMLAGLRFSVTLADTDPATPVHPLESMVPQENAKNDSSAD